MIGKNRVNVFVNVAVQQRVVLYCVEDAIYKSSNVDAQVDSYVSDVVPLHVMTLDGTFEKMDEFSDAVLVQWASNMAADGFQMHEALRVAA